MDLGYGIVQLENHHPYLTGNIGCGKSYVSKYLAKQGVFVFDCDLIAMEVRNENIDTISIMFSIDATDKQKLADIVFSSDEKRIQLENFLYPKIIERLEDIFRKYANEQLIVVE